LKQWPQGQPAYLSLSHIHRRMMLAHFAGIHQIPKVVLLPTGASCFHDGGRTWDLVEWKQGKSVSNPTSDELEQALTALTKIHVAWRESTNLRRAPCTAVQLHHQRLRNWKQDEWQYLLKAPDQLVQNAARLLQRLQPGALCKLEPWLTRPVILQPCLGDIWSEHVLFEESKLTGIVDFGGVRWDHPTQDVVRLLSSYEVSGNRCLKHILDMLPDKSITFQTLIHLLWESSLMVSLSNWIRWLYLENRSFLQVNQCRARIELIFCRLCHQYSNFLD
ncbi:MAG TPA: aminoglycoside phosphotransferase family protein, partial [Gemmatales bacterium]|nr:aminoglycoside phosphotransferase family protein [Gemmatales bacterium]